MKEYTSHEVLAILKKYYITESQQVVSRWIREGKISGTRSENRKDGYRVLEEDLYDFIEEQRPGLPAIMGIYEDYISQVNADVETTTNVTEEDCPNEHVVDQQILQEQIYLIDHKVNEIITLNKALVLENKTLNEDNKVLIELYSLLNEEIIELKRQLKTRKEPKKNKPIQQHEQLSIDNF